jgi:hypothetical protein
MAEIKNIALKATKTTTSGNIWQLTVQYDCVLTEKELRYDFDYKDSFEVWEDDPVNDDKLTGKVGVSFFDPSTKVVKRTLTANINGSTLNTEWFGEEIYVKVFLENTTLNLQYPSKRSGNLSLDP